MIYYLSSVIYHHTIQSTIKEMDELIVDKQVEERILLLKFMKANISLIPNSIDKFLIDLSSVEDLDEEILEAIKMFQMLHDKIRLIIIAPNRCQGDELLSQIFALGIWNIIATRDFLELKEELKLCLGDGKGFKDGVVFKDVRANEVVEFEKRKLVNKVTIGMAGTQGRIGVTHAAIVLAGYLRKKGYLVASIEMNHSGDLQKIREDFGRKLYDKAYYTMDGIDYYPALNDEIKKVVESKAYNFIIKDFGRYPECDKEDYHKCHVRLMVAGSRAWEVPYVGRLLEELADEELKRIYFLFNFTPESNKKPIKRAMKTTDGELLKLVFLEYNDDPFNRHEFVGAEEILRDYFPEKPVKKRRFGFLRT